jgi:hypothetical protein
MGGTSLNRVQRSPTMSVIHAAFRKSVAAPKTANTTFDNDTDA